MIGVSRGMVEIYKTVSQVAPTDATVLIEGETGTGKELIRAWYIVSARARASRSSPWIARPSRLPCSRASCSGHARRVHRRDKDRVGVFEAAHKGTVFLDEIGESSSTFS